MKTGHAFTECYAAPLSDCARRIDREHPISKSILQVLNRTGELKIEGVRWLDKGEERRLSPDALASKMLCNRHNSALSTIDAQALRLFNAMVQLNEELGEGSAQRQRERVWLFNGHDIERWMLKVLCGLIAARMFPLGPNGEVTALPSLDWLEVLWGQLPVPDQCGLYCFGDVGTVHKLSPEVNFRGMFPASRSECVGLEMRFFGFGFGLSLIKDRIFSPAVFRPKHLLFKGVGSANKLIAFGWDRPGDGFGFNLDHSTQPPENPASQIF